jgi:hypothetical protein
MIIAPIGFARTGKDEFAKVLVEKHGFKRFAFADKLRECLYALNPLIGVHTVDLGPTRKKTTKIVPLRLQNVIDESTWDGYKGTRHADEIRGLLQRFGTEVGRDLLSDDIWLKELDKVSGKIVVTDARFPNELEHIVSKGGHLVHIKRPGYGPINDHISETAHLDYIGKARYAINNGHSLERYAQNIESVIGALGVV